MTKHPAARRVHHKAQDEDVFVSGVLESSVWAKSHSQILIGSTIVVVLALALILYLRAISGAKNERAATELAQVRATVQSGNVQLSRQDLDKFIKTYGKTDAGDEARLMLGQVELQGNQAKEAIATLEPLAADVDAPLGYAAALLLGAAYEQNKQPQDAERVYLRLADDARFAFQKREALDRVARLRLDAKNTNGALDAYQRILATFDKDDEAGKKEFEMRIAEVRAQGPTVEKS